ncbi:MAG: hypothetical protein ACFE95_20700 [Candidatus Hodarchaeota archaeon]
MRESNELSIAFQKLRQFENYRFLRLWGFTIIVFGIFTFVTHTRLIQLIVLTLFVEPSQVTKIVDNLSFFFNILLGGVLLGVILYTYRSVKITSIITSHVVKSKNIRLGLAMVIMYLISPRMLTFFFSNIWLFILTYISSSLSDVIATFIAYLILKNSMKSHDFKEVLYLAYIFTFFLILGLILLISTFLLMPNELLFVFFVVQSFGMTISIATCYIITGRFTLKKAQEILNLEYLPIEEDDIKNGQTELDNSK